MPTLRPHILNTASTVSHPQTILAITIRPCIRATRGMPPAMPGMMPGMMPGRSARPSWVPPSTPEDKSKNRFRNVSFLGQQEGCRAEVFKLGCRRAEVREPSPPRGSSKSWSPIKCRPLIWALTYPARRWGFRHYAPLLCTWLYMYVSIYLSTSPPIYLSTYLLIYPRIPGCLPIAGAHGLDYSLALLGTPELCKKA